MRILSLFSGIGGLELGLERAGLGEVIAQVESDETCRRILAMHWPSAERFSDVRTYQCERGTVDLICGGFPCQDTSSANTRGAKGLDGEQSGLWREFRRIVEQAAPRVVVVENVSSGARRWLPFVRRDLHVLGFRTRAFALSAEDVGASHIRRRTFVTAYADRESEFAFSEHGEMGGAPSVAREAPDALGVELRIESGRSEGTRGEDPKKPSWAGGRFVEPDMVRMVHGLSRKLDTARRRALGNSCVPQCAEVIGRVIAEELSRRRAAADACASR